MKPEALLILDGCHPGRHLEVPMKNRRAHSSTLREVFDFEWLGVVFPYPGQRSSDLRLAAVDLRDLPKLGALRTLQEPEEDFALDHRSHHRNLVGSIEKPHQSQESILQFRLRRTDAKAAHVFRVIRGGHLKDEVRYLAWVEMEGDTKERFNAAGVGYPAKDRNFDRGNEIGARLVLQDVVATLDGLRALHDETHDLLSHPRGRLRGLQRTHEANAGDGSRGTRPAGMLLDEIFQLDILHCPKIALDERARKMSAELGNRSIVSGTRPSPLWSIFGGQIKEISMSKNVLITGANKSIGFETARRMGEMGYRIWLGARNTERGEAAAETLRQLGHNVRFIELAVDMDSSVAAAADRVSHEDGKLDVLINNAGIPGNFVAPIDQDLDDIRKVYEINVFGPIRVIKAFLPLLQAAGAANVVNVSSELGSLGALTNPESEFYGVNSLGYNTSKTALNAVTVSFSKALAPLGIRVNSADPGYTKTDFNGNTGYRTVQQAAGIIVELATTDDGRTGSYFNDKGPLPW